MAVTDESGVFARGFPQFAKAMKVFSKQLSQLFILNLSRFDLATVRGSERQA
jgi:hypothetical protein